MDVSTKRKLKICYGQYSRSRKRHPVINLGGHYLEKFGFGIGDYVDLMITQDTVIITQTESASRSKVIWAFSFTN
jgi:hypothetical protein